MRRLAILGIQGRQAPRTGEAIDLPVRRVAHLSDTTAHEGRTDGICPKWAENRPQAPHLMQAPRGLGRTLLEELPAPAISDRSAAPRADRATLEATRLPAPGPDVEPDAETHSAAPTTPPQGLAVGSRDLLAYSLGAPTMVCSSTLTPGPMVEETATRFT